MANCSPLKVVLEGEMSVLMLTLQSETAHQHLPIFIQQIFIVILVHKAKHLPCAYYPYHSLVFLLW